MAIIKDVLNSRVLRGQDVRLLVDDTQMDELTFSVSRDFIKIKIIGSFGLFMLWTKNIGMSSKLKVKHEPSGLVIFDFGHKIIDDVIIECEYDNRIEMTIVWEL